MPADNTSNNTTFNNSGTIGSLNQAGIVAGNQVNTHSGLPAQTASSIQASRTNGSPAFDVCIVCALSEEAQAVMSEFTTGAGVQFKRAFSKITGFAYQHSTIKNSADEELRVLVIWMPSGGPTETVNSVRSLLDEFHPRFMAMSGICAGYKQEVKMGDLIAVADAFHYEEGKVVTDEYNQEKLQPDWKRHSTAKRILQYIHSFIDWKEPVVELKKLLLGRELQPEESPKCIVASIASGMAVQANNPFPHILEHNRKALFLDQEVAAFYQTLNDFPEVYFLAVKGVCDYANQDKNDDYRDYAARAAAIYLLGFIREYILDETMPRK